MEGCGNTFLAESSFFLLADAHARMVYSRKCCTRREEPAPMRRTYQAGDEPVTGYTLRRSLGRGSLGEVWETAGPGGTVVAFKIIDLTEKGGLREFRSIRRMKRVRHPNLVPILAWWLRDDSGRLVEAEEADKAIDDPSYHPAELFIAMGLGDKSLQDRFKECKAQGHPGIPPGELVGYMEDVARAVDHLNSPKHDLGQGLVALHHGDIKPQNLLIVSGAAQLSDSGLARVLGQSSSGTTANVTLAFAPPEILEDTKATPTTDQYTLALTYYYLRTGSLPYSKPDNTTIITETLQGHLDFSRVSPAEQEVLEKAAARNPAQRYPTCMDMARELRRVVELLTSRPTGLVIEPGSELLPGYKLIRNIGRGAFGEVWEASAPGNKRLAIKIIKDLDRTPARLQQELKALDLMQKVVHSHLLELKGCWLLDRKGHSFTREAVNKPGHLPPAVLLLATKLAETSLSKVFEDYKNRGHNGVPIRELLGWLKQAAEALDHLNAPRHQVEGQRVSLQHRNVKFISPTFTWSNRSVAKRFQRRFIKTVSVSPFITRLRKCCAAG
jgi:serine/threonine protein kinase